MNAITPSLKELISICYKNDTKSLKEIVEQGANIFEENNLALMVCVEMGNFSSIYYLMSMGADIYDRNEEALLRAVLYGKVEVVDFLLNINFDLYKEDSFAFQFSAKLGHIELVKYFINKKVNINSGIIKALTYASQYKKEETVLLLLEQKDIDISDKNELIYEAIESNSTLILDKLLDEQYCRSLSVEEKKKMLKICVNKKSIMCFDYLLEKGFLYFPIIDELLIEAASVKKNIIIFKHLESLGANMRKNDKKILSLSIGNEDLDLCLYLLEKGAELIPKIEEHKQFKDKLMLHVLNKELNNNLTSQDDYPKKMKL